MTSIAAPVGAIFGGFGAGGLALALAVLLVLGVRGKGKMKLTVSPAAYVAFVAATAFSAAGQIWANPEKIVGQGLMGLGVGQGSSGPFGDVKLGAVALILVILFLFAPNVTPVFAAVLGLIAGFVFPATGDGTVWAIPAEVAKSLLMTVGG
ncbi:hypothetical protein [Streptomyces xantholiticus]|uniref:hypothetical protein n=1 Tax=Streptomyces xantholiticus TaxID=68285 RepID=UPI00167B15B2|nr:hypothetical protein [Streptomyces xantholiticus]GGW41228.1 hypothetical protein GCM10010381_27600 [Streptomyces xantholiticus]